jgi:hypothetical protein
MGGFFSKIFSKKSRIEPELIERELASKIITASMALGSSFIKNCPNIKEGEKEMQHYVNEFVYIFLHYLGRSAYMRGGKKAKLAIFPCVTEHVVNELASKFDSIYRKQIIDFYCDAIEDSNNFYSERDDLVDSENAFLIWVGAERISKSEDVEEIMVASELITAGLKTLKLDDYVAQILSNS